MTENKVKALKNAKNFITTLVLPQLTDLKPNRISYLKPMPAVYILRIFWQTHLPLLDSMQIRNYRRSLPTGYDVTADEVRQSMARQGKFSSVWVMITDPQSRKCCKLVLSSGCQY